MIDLEYYEVEEVAIEECYLLIEPLELNERWSDELLFL